MIGIFVASDRNYFDNLGHLERLVSAVVAVALWPLLLFGANLHLNF